MNNNAAGYRAVVLAGGFGTRLKATIGDNIPKPMAPVTGRPFLEILLSRLARRGFGPVVLSVGYRHEVIQAHFGAAFQGLKLAYAIEPKPLGTGGGLRLALRTFTHGPVFVFNGDTIADIDVDAMFRAHAASGSTLTMALREVPDTSRYGSCLVRDGRVAAMAARGQGGPGYINAGVYLLEAALLERADLPEAFSFERDFLERRIERLRPLAFPFSGDFIDIGVPEDFAAAQTLLGEKT